MRLWRWLCGPGWQIPRWLTIVFALILLSWFIEDLSNFVGWLP